MIDEALNFGVEGTVEEEAEILGRRRRKRTEGQQQAKDARNVEKGGDTASVLSSLSSSSSESEEEEGCLEKLPGWLAKLQNKMQEPFLPDIELRLYHWQSQVFQRFKVPTTTYNGVQFKAAILKASFLNCFVVEALL